MSGASTDGPPPVSVASMAAAAEAAAGGKWPDSGSLPTDGGVLSLGQRVVERVVASGDQVDQLMHNMLLRFDLPSRPAAPAGVVQWHEEGAVCPLDGLPMEATIAARSGEGGSGVDWRRTHVQLSAMMVAARMHVVRSALAAPGSGKRKSLEAVQSGRAIHRWAQFLVHWGGGGGGIVMQHMRGGRELPAYDPADGCFAPHALSLSARRDPSPPAAHRPPPAAGGARGGGGLHGPGRAGGGRRVPRDGSVAGRVRS